LDEDWVGGMPFCNFGWGLLLGSIFRVLGAAWQRAIKY